MLHSLRVGLELMALTAKVIGKRRESLTHVMKRVIRDLSKLPDIRKSTTGQASRRMSDRLRLGGSGVCPFCIAREVNR